MEIPLRLSLNETFEIRSSRKFVVEGSQVTVHCDSSIRKPSTLSVEHYIELLTASTALKESHSMTFNKDLQRWLPTRIGPEWGLRDSRDPSRFLFIYDPDASKSVAMEVFKDRKGKHIPPQEFSTIVSILNLYF